MTLSLLLLDPFQRHWPARVEAVINDGGPDGRDVQCTAYSACGAWLAALCAGGRVAVWDAQVGGRPVADYATGLAVSAGARPCGIVFADAQICVSYASGAYAVLEIPSARVIRAAQLSAPDTGADASLVFATPNVLVWSSGAVERIDCASGERTTLHFWEDGATAACVSEDGSSVCIGSPKGTLLVLESNGSNWRATEISLGCASPVVAVSASADGRWVAAATRDRCVRVVHRQTGAVRFRMSDAVNKYAWRCVGFGGAAADTSLVYAAVADAGRHLVYLWDLSSAESLPGGTLPLRTILDGGRDDLRGAAWRPGRPELHTLSSSGRVRVWKAAYPASWSALVPGVEEIDENVVYEEREDDFDLIVDDAPAEERVAAPAVPVDAFGMDDAQARLCAELRLFN